MNTLNSLKIAFLFFSFTFTSFSQSLGQILPLADLNTTDNSSYPNGFIEFNGYTYFLSNVGLHKTISSGVTEIVDNDNLLGHHNYPQSKEFTKFLYIFNSELYYFKRNSANTEIWKTDGINKQMVLSNLPYDYNNSFTKLYYINNNLCYFSRDKMFRVENNSSVLLGTFSNISLENINFNPVALTNAIIFYTFAIGTLQVWKTDGTVAGTTQIGNIPNFDTSQIELERGSLNNNRCVLLNNEVYILFPKFLVNGNSSSLELWKINGQSLAMIKVLNSDSRYVSINNLTEKNGKILFTYGNYQFWMSDGTSAGTVMVKILNIPTDYSKRKWGYFNGYYYFGASENSIAGLWKSDGTAAGTTKVYDYGIDPYSNLTPEYFFETNSNLYFVANQSELWKTDGTNNGTVKIPNYSLNRETLQPSLYNIFYPEIFKNSANQLLWKGGDVQNGFELWKSNSTIENSTLLNNIVTKTNKSIVSDVKCKINDTWFFNGINDKGMELWKTDGTVAGTQMVIDLNIGPKNTYIYAMTSMQGILYFTASDSESNKHFYRSDGTAAGTYEISLGVNNYYFIGDQLVSDSNKVYFIATSTTGSYTGTSIPWVSDGTVQGTHPIPFSGGVPQFASNLTFANNKIFFIEGYKIWTGDSNLIRPIYDAAVGDKPYFPKNLIEFNNKIYMLSRMNIQSLDALFETDGTEVGTKVVKTFPSGSVSGTTNYYFEKSNNRLFFREQEYTNNGTLKINLWSSDGTDAGTIKLKELGTVYTAGSLRSRTIGNQLILFTGNVSPSDSIRAWSTDGTVAGTTLIFKQKASINEVVGIGKSQNKLFFSCLDQNYFYELWQTDGTASGTVRIGQNQQSQPPLQPSFFPISPKSDNILDFNQRLLFWTHDNLTDYEPWYYQLSNCQNNINYTLKSGNWSDVSCWSCGFVPTANQSVIIKNSHTISLLSNTNVSVKAIRTEIGGILKFQMGALMNVNN